MAFAATALVVIVATPRRRLVASGGLALSLLAIYAWYAPHSGAVESSSRIPDGVRIEFPWVVTAPVDQILLPSLIWIDSQSQPRCSGSRKLVPNS